MECEILGRSDPTLNRHGVRIGSAEIYAAVDFVEGIADSLVVGVEQPDGGYWMPLFVALQPGTSLDDDLVTRIRDAIRASTSPRHVPDEVPGVPGHPADAHGQEARSADQAPADGRRPGRGRERLVAGDAAALDASLSSLRIARERARA